MAAAALFHSTHWNISSSYDKDAAEMGGGAGVTSIRRPLHMAGDHNGQDR